jgi:sugar phosphate isomerase/epimerase
MCDQIVAPKLPTKAKSWQRLWSRAVPRDPLLAMRVADAGNSRDSLGVNLDIGHFTAANYDPVQYIKEHHDRIFVLHLKDRKRDQGANMPWGEGDTAIKPVLQLLKKEKYPMRAYVEYEYRGAADSITEVKKCIDFTKSALA